MAQPLYVTIKNKILEQIKGVDENTPIESERELALKFNASRMTVRAAINELVDDGFLYRHENKGTFVSSNSIIKKNTALDYFKEAKHLKLIHMNLKEMPDIANKFGVSDTTKFVRILCINYKDNNEKEVISIDEIFYLYEELDIQDRGNVDALMRICRNDFDKISIQYRAINIPIKFTKLMKVPLNTPVIENEIVLFDKMSKIKCIVNSCLNPNTTSIITVF